MTKVDKSKSRLGRGLNSLLSISTEEPTLSGLPVMLEIPAPGVVPDLSGEGTPPPGTTILQLNLGQISPNPHQPRKQMDEVTIADLAASLKMSGIIQPIIVRQTPDGYQLIAGERRLRAAKLAGLEAIPAIVRDVDGATQAQMALVENIQREDLNPIDRAKSYRALMDQLGLTQAELATRLGEERSGIANYLRLLNLTEAVRDYISDGRLTLGHAKLLAGVDDILEQQRLADLVLSSDLSVRNLERLLQNQTVTPPPARPKSVPSAHLHDLEQSLTRQIGMRVQVRSNGKNGRGTLTVHYNSLDQFDELLNRMGTKVES